MITWPKRMLLIGIAVSSLLFVSCEEEVSKKRVIPKAESLPSLIVPEFEADSAFAWIEKQVDFGPRVPNSPGHVACGDWLIQKFVSYGATVDQQIAEAQVYTGARMPIRNIIIRLAPEKKKRIMLSAHWDTRHIAEKEADKSKINTPIIGANDGASGVAVLLELARHIGRDSLYVGVDMFLWDLEDYGDPENGNEKTWALGSQYWSNNRQPANYMPRYGINLDMVGAAGARFPKEGYSIYFAKRIVDKVWNIAHQAGYGEFFPMEEAGAIIDDHKFINEIAAIPTLDIIHMNQEQGFFDQHHTQGDDLSVISKESLKAVGQTLLTLLYREQ